jgi:hypothetical protein
LIEFFTTRWMELAKQLPRQNDKIKFCNMEITPTGIAGYWTDAGPAM